MTGGEKTMNMEMITPVQRLGRMRESFGISKSVLAEDYLYFTTPITPHASTLRSKAVRKSAEQSERLSLERNETQSSDKIDD